jgi:hypothetical protein
MSGRRSRNKGACVERGIVRASVSAIGSRRKVTFSIALLRTTLAVCNVASTKFYPRSSPMDGPNG